MNFLYRSLAAAALLSASVMPVCSQIPAKDRTVIVISLDGFPAYALDDPQLPIPTLRQLARTGSTSKRMTTINPTVTWPNHTAMVTGVNASKHGLLYNGTLVRQAAVPMAKVDPNVVKEKMVHATTVYDVAHAAGLTTAQVDWVAINQAPTINWEFSEFASPQGAIEKEMIGLGIVKAAEVEQFRKLNILRRDQIWTDAAIHILQKHKPNLLLLHLLSLDSTHHTYGPRSLASQDAIAFLDSCVARVTSAVREAGMVDRTTIIVVSDHGFKAVTKQIRATAALAAAGIGDGVQVIPEGGTAMVYVDKSRAGSLVPQVRKAVQAIEGVGQVLEPKDFDSQGLPTPDKDPQMADLVLVAKPEYAFAAGADAPVIVAEAQKTGSHGYLASDPEMDAIFIASGYGMRHGATLDRIRNVDVAPTIAELLGLKLEHINGRALRTFLGRLDVF